VTARYLAVTSEVTVRYLAVTAELTVAILRPVAGQGQSQGKTPDGLGELQRCQAPNMSHTAKYLMQSLAHAPPSYTGPLPWKPRK
jgi:hypothetical protein